MRILGADQPGVGEGRTETRQAKKKSWYLTRECVEERKESELPSENIFS